MNSQGLSAKNWEYQESATASKLTAVRFVDNDHGWAVGDQGVILHYVNHAPEICRVLAEPQTVYAGEPVYLYVSVKDLDGPSDILKVTVDAQSIGRGMVVLEPAWQDYDDRRCVLFQGKAVVSPLAAYGAHQLPVEVIDYDGACAGGKIDLFVITSWVEIKRTRAIPNPVVVGGKVLLAVQVDIVAPKGPDSEENNLFHNKIEKVTVDITELLGVDCQPGSDCIIIVEMTDPDGDGIYTYVAAPVTGSPGNYKLPVWAVDTLGHHDKAELSVKIVPASICEGDFDVDGDVDGSDLAIFAGDFGRTDCGTGEPCEGDFNDDGDVDGSDLAVFAADFGRTDCPGSLKIPYIKPKLSDFLLDLRRSLAHKGFAKILNISTGMPAVFANPYASRSQHISSQKIAQLRLKDTQTMD